MQTVEIFKFLRDDIHTVVMATVDDGGNAVTCAVDIMDCDAGGLYFLTARGKSLYARLKTRPHVSLTGIKGDSMLTRVAVSVSGCIEELGREELSTLLDKNRYMYKIYPDEASRTALAAFRLYRGKGEIFDLSKLPVVRHDFVFGGQPAAEYGYSITKECVLCGKCREVCPQNCIIFGDSGARIDGKHCLRCGNCKAVCPCGAVILKN